MDLITNQTRENHQFRPSESELGTFGFHSDELGGFEETEGLRERWEEKGGGGWVGGGGAVDHHSSGAQPAPIERASVATVDRVKAQLSASRIRGASPSRHRRLVELNRPGLIKTPAHNHRRQARPPHCGPRQKIITR